MKLSRKERKARAEQKKENIRGEIFEIMLRTADAENLSPSIDVNRALRVMIKQNPQESHLVKSVIAEIRYNTDGYVKAMLKKYWAD